MDPQKVDLLINYLKLFKVGKANSYFCSNTHSISIQKAVFSETYLIPVYTTARSLPRSVLMSILLSFANLVVRILY